eukprot:CAMPEP_0182810132 /NCGR_PEP_ID=MMETSP0006_2-20121128/7564_1 /TAXON_ID=97485 /ORGANISM="Prymnesium parvum, Strain Texoma1" /LENGTH=59 /DNA_ID=CAMNT_0024935983 /DNA_START=212 /DNA_END=388 /DNA_ORIENTATION=-
MRSSQAIALSPSLRQFSPELLRRRRPLGGLQLRVEFSTSPIAPALAFDRCFIAKAASAA